MINVLELFYSQVRNDPQKAAVVDQGGCRTTSYAELADMSERLAAWLLNNGIGREKLVAIRVSRGVPFIACRFATMMVGGAWVGVEDMMGADRVNYIIKDSEAVLTVDDELFSKALTEEPLPKDKWAEPDPHDMAFVFYTSGSTGNAKGVVQEYGVYKNVLSSLKRATEGFEFLNYANIAPETFIGGLYLMTGCLCMGYTLHIIPLPLVRDPAGLLDYFKKHHITCSCMPPTLIKALESAGGLDLQLLHVTGEIVSDLFIERFLVRNAYGPTEFSYLPFFFDIDKSYKNTPIGTPDKDSIILLLNENNCRDSAEGKMCIHLPYFRGYLHDNDRTCFIDIDGVTYFISGDYMAVDKNGNYTILGRSDDMVKINGNRIEPSEVEFAIKKVLGTDFAAVKAWERGASRYLCAYHNCGRDLDAAEMAELLKDHLPLYMIPACYISIDEIPLNENGKINKKALTQPDDSLLFAPFVKPNNDFQQMLCNAFADALHIAGDRIGIDDDFFLLGGNSLAAIEVITAMQRVDLTVSMLYKERTVRSVERALQNPCHTSESNNAAKESPLTDEQMYFLEHETGLPGRMIYNQPMILSFSTDIDEDKLSEAVLTVFSSHPALLTVIKKEKDCWYQQVVYENNIKPVTVVISEEDLREEEKQLVQPFSFDGLPLFRIKLFRTPKRVALFLDFHHIICDGYSLRIVVEDILSAYKDEDISKDSWIELLSKATAADDSDKEEDRQYFDYAYNGQFNRLPVSDSTGTGQREGSIVYPFSFRTNAVFKAAQQLHLSVNAFYILASAVSLMAYNNTDKVMLSWTFNGRSEVKAIRTVGMMIRDYPLSLSFNNEDTVQSAASSVNRQIQKAIMHGSISPFMARNKGEMFCFIYQGDILKKPDCDQLLRIDYLEIPEKTAIEPLEFHIHEDEECPRTEILYDTGIYTPESMERFAGIYESVCKLLLSDNSKALRIRSIITDISKL